jgi:hypothetical protein
MGHYVGDTEFPGWDETRVHQGAEERLPERGKGKKKEERCKPDHSEQVSIPFLRGKGLWQNLSGHHNCCRAGACFRHAIIVSSKNMKKRER